MLAELIDALLTDFAAVCNEVEAVSGLAFGSVYIARTLTMALKRI